MNTPRDLDGQGSQVGRKDAIRFSQLGKGGRLKQDFRLGQDDAIKLRHSTEVQGGVPEPEVSVAVCVLTYKRPEGLERLLLKLNKLEFKKCSSLRIEIVVIDNDPVGSARQRFENLRGTLRWPAKYRIEVRPGIAYGRNQAVATAGPETDYIAFIDDDEVPEPSWLDELMNVQKCYEGDVVTGTVLADFEEPPPRWALKCGDFDRQRHATGKKLDCARTGNVLIKSSLFWKHGLWFEERLARTNADDTHFFMRVHRLGHKIVWANDAVIWEHVTKDRLQVRWLLRRAYLAGNWYTECLFDLDKSLTTRGLRFVREAVRIAYGTVQIAGSLFLGGDAFVSGLNEIAIGSGAIARVIGIRLYAR